MNRRYKDIMSRIDTSPLWFDEDAVPRYCEFSPDACANVYAREVALLEIACQGCAHRFLVCLSRSSARSLVGGSYLAEKIERKEISYGDPPNIGCCPAGPTMSSIPLQVLEYHYAPSSGRWKRDPEYEIELDSDDLD